MTEFRSDALIRSDTSYNEIIVENRVGSNEVMKLVGGDCLIRVIVFIWKGG